MFSVPPWLFFYHGDTENIENKECLKLILCSTIGHR